MEFAELQYHYLDFLSTLKKEKKNVLTFLKNKLFRRNFSSFLLPGLYSSTYIGNGKYYFKGKLLGEKNKVNEKKTKMGYCLPNKLQYYFEPYFVDIQKTFRE